MEKTGTSKGIGFLCVLASIVVSIVFVIAAFATPIYYSVAGFLQPQTISTVIQNVDYAQVLKQSDEMGQIIKNIGIDEQSADEIMKSKEVGNLLKDFSSELATTLVHSHKDLDDIDGKLIQEYVDKHSDEIIPVIKAKSNTDLSDDKIKEELKAILENSDSEIKEAAVGLQPVKETISDLGLITKIYDWPYALCIAVIEILMLTAIYFLRKKNYGGLIWIAVNTGLVGIFVSGAAAIVASGLVKDITKQIPGFLGSLVGTAIDTVSSKLTIAAVVCFVVMVAAIVACVVLKSIKRKKQTVSAVQTSEQETV